MQNESVIANAKINKRKLTRAQKIIEDLYQELSEHIKNGCGPFLAAIYDSKGHLIAKAANSVVLDKCSHSHAEINVIKATEKILNTYDLSAHNLTLYVTAEPCMMCLGAILWSGIKEIYYGVSSDCVETITGFDEGPKPNWQKEFKSRGIAVYGLISAEMGKKVLKEYMKQKHPVYKPKRK